MAERRREAAVLEIAEIVDAAIARAVNGIERPVPPEGRGGAVQRLVASVRRVAHRCDVAQQRHAVEQRMAVNGMVFASPFPFGHVGTLTTRDPVECPVERQRDRRFARLGHLGAAVVAPPRLVAQDTDHQGHVGHGDRIEQVLAQLVGQQSALQLGDPGVVDQRLWPARQHEHVPAAQQVARLGGTGVARRALQQVGQHLGGIEREIVGLHDNHAVDRMTLDLTQELGSAALAIGLGPVPADEVAVVVGHQAAVGVDDQAAHRIVDAGQLFERHEACPIKLGGPARYRHRAIALASDGHACRRDQADIPRCVGIDHVLHRRDDAPGGRQEFVPILRRADAGKALRRGVGAVERGRLQGKHMSLRREVLATADEVIDHRTVPRLADSHRDRIAPGDLDGLVSDGEGSGAVRCDVAVWIGRIDALDEYVLAVEVSGRESPADGSIVAQHDGGRARRGGATDIEARSDQTGEVPDAGKAESEMRVVGEKRPPRDRMSARKDPFVRGLALASHLVVGAVENPVDIDVLHGGHDHRQGRVLAVAGRLDQELHAVLADLLRQPQSQQFGPPVAVETECHELGPHQRIGRTPGVRPVAADGQELDQREFQPELLIIVRDPCIDARGVGIESRAHGGRKGIHALRGAPVDPETAHGPVAVYEAAADQAWRHEF